MFERFLCDVIFTDEDRFEIQELICADRDEAVEWLEQYFLELHFDRDVKPDAVRLRKGDAVVTEWTTHFDGLS